MKIIDIIENIIRFPSDDRDYEVRNSRLRATDHPEEFIVVDSDNKAHGIFPTKEEANKAIPRLEMKSGKRKFRIRPI